MKKIIIILACFLSETCFAQEGGLQKIAFGTVFASSGSMKLSDKVYPFDLGYNLSPNVIFITGKTFHNFLYGFGNNAIRTVNGYFPKKNIDIYVVFQKSTTSKGGYTSLGIEKMIKAGDVNFFIFTEVGRTFNPYLNTITIGMHANIQTPIWKRKI